MTRSTVFSHMSFPPSAFCSGLFPTRPPENSTQNWEVSRYTEEVIKTMGPISGAKLEPDEILSLLGAGGMDEVYRRPEGIVSHREKPWR